MSHWQEQIKYAIKDLGSWNHFCEENNKSEQKIDPSLESVEKKIPTLYSSIICPPHAKP